jgi:thioesterase domain-containing protein
LEHAFQLLRTANVELLVMEKAWLKEQVALFARRLRVAQAYQARTYTGHMTLFRSQEEDKLEHEQAEMEDLGWQHFSQYRLEVHTIPGFHASMITEPHVQKLADLFWHCLEQRYAEVQASKRKDIV